MSPILVNKRLKSIIGLNIIEYGIANTPLINSWGSEVCGEIDGDWLVVRVTIFLGVDKMGIFPIGWRGKRRLLYIARPIPYAS